MSQACCHADLSRFESDRLHLLYIVFLNVSHFFGFRSWLGFRRLPRSPCSAARLGVLVHYVLPHALYAGDRYSGEATHTCYTKIWAEIKMHKSASLCPLCCFTVWEHGGHHHGCAGRVSAAQGERAAQVHVLGRLVFWLLPDGSPVSHWRECVFNKHGSKLHLLCDYMTHVFHVMCVSS